MNVKTTMERGANTQTILTAQSGRGTNRRGKTRKRSNDSTSNIRSTKIVAPVAILLIPALLPKRIARATMPNRAGSISLIINPITIIGKR
jgi:hypothetical protein